MIRRLSLQGFSLRAIFFLCLATLLLVSCKTPGTITNPSHQDTVSADKAFYQKQSALLGVKLSGKEDRKLIAEISEWIGVPYKYGGTEKTGTDCSGFTMTVIKKVYGICLYRIASDQVKNTKSVEMKDLRCGDLVFFKINQPKVSHVGLYIAENKFIHATLKGVMVNDLNEDYYKKYYCCGGHITGVPDQK